MKLTIQNLNKRQILVVNGAGFFGAVGKVLESVWDYINNIHCHSECDKKYPVTFKNIVEDREVAFASNHACKDKCDKKNKGEL